MKEDRQPLVGIIYPRTINWFYRYQADMVREELIRCGVCSVSIPSDDIASIERGGTVALILSYWECSTDAGHFGVEGLFHKAIRSFDRRILLNYDSLSTQYFRRHFIFRPGQLTEIIDVCMMSQTELRTINGIPYRQIPETFCAAELRSVEPWSEGRPLPWSMLGHANAARAALITACLKRIHPGGLVFMPPIRPYTSGAALERNAIHQVLQQTDLYIWGSHHSVPYHEGLRALHAVAAGAVPCKIDPLHHAKFANIPWVYRSLSDLKEACVQVGLAELHRNALAWLEANGTMGPMLIGAMGLITPIELTPNLSAPLTSHSVARSS